MMRRRRKRTPDRSSIVARRPSSSSSLFSFSFFLLVLVLFDRAFFLRCSVGAVEERNASSSSVRARDASSSLSARKREQEEDARVVEQLAANLMMDGGGGGGARRAATSGKKSNDETSDSEKNLPRNRASSDNENNNNNNNNIVRTRPDVDAAFLYRISGEMVAKMRARMPPELVQRGDPEAEARYASARCEDLNGGIALNFIFDFFDALLEAVGFRAYDEQTNRMYQMHTRSNRSASALASTTREANDDNDAAVMINIEDAFYTRAKSFYLANKDEKANAERLHRALGKFEEGDAFAACPSDINAWTWLFSFFPLDLSIFGVGDNGAGGTSTNATNNVEGGGGTFGGIGGSGVTSSTPSYSPNYDPYPPASGAASAIIVAGIKKCTLKNCLYPRACCDVTQTGHLSCVYHFSLCPDYCGSSDDFKRCDSGPPKGKEFTAKFIDSFTRYCCGSICCPIGYVCCQSPEIVGHNGNKCEKKDICNQVRSLS